MWLTTRIKFFAEQIREKIQNQKKKKSEKEEDEEMTREMKEKNIVF